MYIISLKFYDLVACALQIFLLGVVCGSFQFIPQSSVVLPSFFVVSVSCVDVCVHACTRACVCMDVCVCVCTYVCMYVCIYVWMDGWMMDG
jgi:hypothetical protein